MLIESKKPRVVIDTNVFVSGLNFAGKPGEVLELFVNGDIDVVISPFILEISSPFFTRCIAEEASSEFLKFISASSFSLPSAISSFSALFLSNS